MEKKINIAISGDDIRDLNLLKAAIKDFVSRSSKFNGTTVEIAINTADKENI